MTHRTTIAFTDDAFRFLQTVAENRPSDYINQLVLTEKNRALQEAILKAHAEIEADEEYLKELALWDATLMDGLDPDD